jgi:hypothetical protein
MDTYLLVHRHPHNYKGGPETFAAWEAWFKELGHALVDLGGNPVVGDRGVAGEVGTLLPLGGYTIVEAQNLDEATRLTQGCPIVAEGGAVEVRKLTTIPGRQHPARTF